MIEDILNSDEPLDKPLSDEEKLAGIKAKADSLGIRYHPKIKAPKLLAKIEEHNKKLEAENRKARRNEPQMELESAQLQLAKASIQNTNTTGNESLREKRKKQLELVRVRVNPLNTHMSGLKGQYFTVCNGLVGRVTKYIPFNSPYGWHIPRILLDELESKKYQVFREFKDPNGRTRIKNELAKAYAIEILPPLTPEELKEIRANIARTEGMEDY